MVQLMMTQEQVDAFSNAAAYMAGQTSTTNLRLLATFLGEAHARTPVGDDRTELGILHEAYEAILRLRAT